MSGHRTPEEALREFKRRTAQMKWVAELLYDLAEQGFTLEDVFLVSDLAKTSPKMKSLIGARHYAWAFVRDRLYPAWSWPSLGYLLGVDHTTIMAAMGKFAVGQTIKGVPTEVEKPKQKRRKNRGR